MVMMVHSSNYIHNVYDICAVQILYIYPLARNLQNTAKLFEVLKTDDILLMTDTYKLLSLATNKRYLLEATGLLSHVPKSLLSF